MVLYEISDGAIRAPGVTILAGLALAIDDRRCTVVLGPAGTGKTSLISALSGCALPGDLVVDGQWRFQGRARRYWAGDRIAWARQPRKGVISMTWQQALDADADVALLDEPCGSLRETGDLPALIAAVRARAAATIVVTHNLELAKAIADRVVLLCAGRIESAGDGAQFFDAPPTALAAQFVARGNCWPQHALPSHFRWLRPHVGGMGRPGLFGDVHDDLAALAANGVGALVSLTETAFPRDQLALHGIDAHHVPIPDMRAPTLQALVGLCETIAAAELAGTRIVVHCHGGVGRTGTVLAAYLVWRGADADAAIATVRTQIRGAVQTAEQAQIVQRLAACVAGREVA